MKYSLIKFMLWEPTVYKNRVTYYQRANKRKNLDLDGGNYEGLYNCVMGSPIIIMDPCTS